MRHPSTNFEILRAEVIHRQVPIDNPVKTAFGTMTDRHLVALKITDERRNAGVGESWVNFPAWAPWERAAAFERAIIPYLLNNRPVDDIPAYVTGLFNALLGPARQSGSIGPLLQAVCAVEGALWEILARRSALPLCKLLFDNPHPSVQVYASGINSPLPRRLIQTHLDQGVTLFKLKLGFGDKTDQENLLEMKRLLGSDARLAVDVNRGWSYEQAAGWLPRLADLDIVWLEEPLTAAEEHRLGELQTVSSVPIAGGENVMTPPGEKVEPLLERSFDIWQPDVTKYTPLHVAVRLIEAARDAGKPEVVPHFLGSGPGQALSLQLAAGCPRGLVELDINRNPLRTDLLSPLFEIVDGRIPIPDRPGIGWKFR